MPSMQKAKVQLAGHGKLLASILEPMDLVAALPSATKGASGPQSSDKLLFWEWGPVTW